MKLKLNFNEYLRYGKYMQFPVSTGHPTQLQEIMIQSKVKNIIRAVVDLALLPRVFRNPDLLDTKCTEDSLLPIQVFF